MVTGPGGQPGVQPDHGVTPAARPQHELSPVLVIHSPDKARQILENPFYIALSSSFGQNAASFFDS